MLLLCLGLAFYLMTTETGMRVVLNIIASSISGTFSYEQAHGNLWHGIRFTDFHYHDETTHISCKNLSVDWEIFYKERRLAIDSLKADGIKINTQPSQGRLDINKLTKELSFLNVRAVHVTHAQLNKINISAINYVNEKLQVISNYGSIDGQFNFKIVPKLQWQADLTAFKVDPGFFIPKVQGNLSIIFSSQGEIDGNQSKVTLNITKFTGSLQGKPINASANIFYNNNKLSIKDTSVTYAGATSFITGSLNQNWDINWKLQVPNLENFAPDVNGSVKSQGHISGLAATPHLEATVQLDNVSDIKTIQTSVSADFNIAKRWLSLKISNGKIIIPRWGISASDIILSANGNINNTVPVMGSFAMQKSIATVNGQLNLSLPLTTHLTLTAQNLPFINLKDYQVTLSPNLTVDYDTDNLRLNGKIDIPNATIKSINYEDVVTLPSDVEIIDDRAKAVSLPLSISYDIYLHVNNQFHVIYNNLNTNIAGDLHLYQDKSSVATANGELHTIKGTYKAYGMNLALENGRLIYTGNTISNPGLDLLATRKINTVSVNTSSNQFGVNNSFTPTYTGNQTIKVGVSVKGTLQKPAVTLISDSNLAQQDILSYLVFGKPKSELSPIDAVTLLSTMTLENNYLNSTSLLQYPGKILNKLNLDEFGIGNTATFDPTSKSINNESTLNIGKQIGKNLYVRYSVGIMNSLQMLNLRYQLNKYLAIQSETSTIENGADLLFSLER